MTDLTVRRVRYDFASEDVPFNWNPERPAFSMFCNMLTFAGPGFETFIVDATREAIPLMRDPADVEDANAYLRQEAQHSAAHMSHYRGLIRTWPGLQETMDAVHDSFKRLTATKPLEWRLAYVACIENTFTPYFRTFIEHDDLLFAPGDERVASLMLWHFVEEMEHRSSALRVYDAVNGSYAYRFKVLFEMARHMSEILAIVTDGFRTHVPTADGGHIVDLLPQRLTPRAMLAANLANRRLARSGRGASTYTGIPKREVLDMVIGLIKCQAPGHKPVDERIPAFATQWFARYDEDPDIASRFYSTAGAGA